MNKILSYLLVVAMTAGFLVFGVLGGLHYEKLEGSTLFHILTWGIIAGSVLYFVGALARRRARPQAKRVLQQMAQSQVSLLVRSLKWMIFWPVVGGVIVFVGLSLFVLVRTGK